MIKIGFFRKSGFTHVEFKRCLILPMENLDRPSYLHTHLYR
jgi:hypothetical protein